MKKLQNRNPNFKLRRQGLKLISWIWYVFTLEGRDVVSLNNFKFFFISGPPFTTWAAPSCPRWAWRINDRRLTSWRWLRSSARTSTTLENFSLTQVSLIAIFCFNLSLFNVLVKEELCKRCIRVIILNDNYGFYEIFLTGVKYSWMPWYF